MMFFIKISALGNFSKYSHLVFLIIFHLHILASVIRTQKLREKFRSFN